MCDDDVWIFSGGGGGRLRARLELRKLPRGRWRASETEEPGRRVAHGGWVIGAVTVVVMVNGLARAAALWAAKFCAFFESSRFTRAIMSRSNGGTFGCWVAHLKNERAR